MAGGNLLFTIWPRLLRNSYLVAYGSHQFKNEIACRHQSACVVEISTMKNDSRSLRVQKADSANLLSLHVT